MAFERFLVLFLLVCTVHSADLQYIATIHPNTISKFTSLLSNSTFESGISIVKRIQNNQILLLSSKLPQISFLQSLPQVVFVEPNFPVSIFSKYIQNLGSGLWHLDTISKLDFDSNDGKFEFSYTGLNVHAYVFDTGISDIHVDFEQRVSRFRSYTGDTCSDCNGHGTHVAGLLGGTTYGIAKNATLFDVQVLGRDGLGDTFTVIDAIYDVSDAVTQKSIGVMSLGGPKSTAMKNAVTYAKSKGLFLAVSAGNSAHDACNHSPADSPHVITVASHDKNGKRSDFSNYGQCLNIYAPGDKIKSTFIGSPTATTIISGTSMAAPIIAGIMATLLEQNPTIEFDEIDSLLQSQSKIEFQENDAPAAISTIQASPCGSYCSSSILTMEPYQLFTYGPSTPVVAQKDGVLNAWLYPKELTSQKLANSIFIFSIINSDTGKTVQSIRSNIYPLNCSTNVLKDERFIFHVNRTTNPENEYHLTLFVESPLICSATLNCSSNGNCDANGNCVCFINFYGSNCSRDSSELFILGTLCIGGIIYIVFCIAFALKKKYSNRSGTSEERERLLQNPTVNYSRESRRSSQIVL